MNPELRHQASKSHLLSEFQHPQHSSMQIASV